MPPVTLDCDKGAPVGGAKCLVKCKDGASRATQSEINCICNSKTCKWQEWKQLKKNEIKCLNPSSGSKSESAGGDMCDPLPKERLQIEILKILPFSYSGRRNIGRFLDFSRNFCFRICNQGIGFQEILVWSQYKLVLLWR